MNQGLAPTPEGSTTYLVLLIVCQALLFWSELAGSTEKGHDAISHFIVRRIEDFFGLASERNKETKNPIANVLLTLLLAAGLAIATWLWPQQDSQTSSAPANSTTEVVDLRAEIARLRMDLQQARQSNKDSQSGGTNCQGWVSAEHLAEVEAAEQNMEARRDAAVTEKNQAKAQLEACTAQVSALRNQAAPNLEPRLVAANAETTRTAKQLMICNAQLAVCQNEDEVLVFPASFENGPTLLVFTREQLWHVSDYDQDEFTLIRADLQLHRGKIRYGNRDFDIQFLPEKKEREKFLNCWKSGSQCWEQIKQTHRARLNFPINLHTTRPNP